MEGKGGTTYNRCVTNLITGNRRMTHVQRRRQPRSGRKSDKPKRHRASTTKQRIYARQLDTRFFVPGEGSIESLRGNMGVICHGCTVSASSHLELQLFLEVSSLSRSYVRLPRPCTHRYHPDYLPRVLKQKLLSARLAKASATLEQVYPRELYFHIIVCRTILLATHRPQLKSEVCSTYVEF